MSWIERHYELSATLTEGIEQLHAALAAFWPETDIDPAAQARFSTALAEVVANILQYAVAPGDAPVRLRLRCSPTRIEARLVDSGQGWEEATSAYQLPDDWDERGRGLAIASAILDRLRYRRINNLNCWRLVLLR